MKIWGISPSNNLDFDIGNNFTKFWYAQVIFMEKKNCDLLMTLTLTLVKTSQHGVIV